MKYYNITFYVSGLLLLTSSFSVTAENLPMTDNPYAPPPPLENESVHLEQNAQTFWEDKHRTPDNPWLAAHQAMLYTPPTTNTWSNNAAIPAAPPTYYPQQTYNAYPQASPYAGTMPSSGHVYSQGYNSYMPTPSNNYAYVPAQQQYAPQNYPQYSQQPAYQVQQPNYNYNVPSYANPAQAQMGYPNQMPSGFIPNTQYNAPVNNALPPNYQGNSYYPPAAQWSSPQNQAATGQPTYNAPEQRLMQRLDRQSSAMPNYPNQYMQQGQTTASNTYAQPYQMPPMSNSNNYPYMPEQIVSNQAMPQPQMPPQMTPPAMTSPQPPMQGYVQMPINPLTQTPNNVYMPPANASQQEVIVVQRPQPGTGEYKLKEVLGPAPGDPMIFHAREPDAERPKPGTGEYKVKELLGPAPGDPRAYQALTEEAVAAANASEVEAEVAPTEMTPNDTTTHETLPSSTESSATSEAEASSAIVNTTEAETPEVPAEPANAHVETAAEATKESTEANTPVTNILE